LYSQAASNEGDFSMWPFSARKTRRPIRRPLHPSRRPLLEALEDRLTPSGGGLLDPTFNGTGTETLPQATCSSANAVAVQPDGKIVSVGWNGDGIAVVRMNPNGTLDTSFNGTGLVSLNVARGALGNAVALQPDGKILVGGYAYAKPHRGDPEYVVARLNPDGSLDRTFGNSRGMWLSNPTGDSEVVRKLAVLTDAANHVTGILAGGDGLAGGLVSFAAIKLTPAGLPDASFGAGGFAVANVGGGGEMVKGMAVTPAGGIVMAGTVGSYAAVVAFTAAGQLDPSFNGTGYRMDNLAGAGGATGYKAVAVQPLAGGGYGIVVAGDLETDHNYGLVARYTATGQFDATFGSGGFLVTGPSSFRDVALAADGSIVVAGAAFFVTESDGQLHHEMAVGHLTADGAMDTTFGTAGTGISTVPPINATGSDDANSLAIAPDGQIVIAGITNATLSTQQAAFARFTAP
jgi:uncharacterized delta-60 repeat protein